MIFIVQLKLNSMRIGIAETQTTELVAESIKETLSDAGFESFYLKNNSKVTMADLVIVLGGDRGVRNYFHNTLDTDTPVLGISESESNGVLAQIELKEFPSYLNRIKTRITSLKMYQESV
uniref:NAD(+) kinase (PpnK, NADK) n=1 Tax=uncultured marine thaumarchaeote AD1000_39_D02 TaxID=1455912 RepID=A0A075FPT2_9ARCH|nr:NAD(+) kinase (ppnK, NADK) [uncultured marine thaumarchaeote AD1000_39_D02]